MDAARIRLLYEHNAWANCIILDRAATLSEADYFADAPGISFGSLHTTLNHILDGEWSWFCRMRGEPMSVWQFDTDEPNLEALRSRWRKEEAANLAYLATLSEADVEATLRYEHNSGVWDELPYWQALLHVLTHSIQFRGEAAVRLTQLGASPGHLDLNNYIDEHPLT